MFSAFQPHSRTRLLAIAIGLLMAVFTVRLFYLQVIEHSKYSSLAQSEQVKRLIIPASRGEIYMMDEDSPVKVVLNEPVYTVYVVPRQLTDADKIVSTLKNIAGGNTVSNFAKLVAPGDSWYAVVAKNVTRRQAQLIKDEHLAGVGFQEVSQRVYPEKTLGSQILGFVNYEDKGQYGVEEAFDSQLKGKDGLLQSVTDVSNVPLTIGNNNIDVPKQDGKNIVLTIDRNIQAYTEQALAGGLKKLGANKGSVVVMDPQTGKVMAMANYPTYNPGEYYKVTNAAAFNNGVISTPYEPGSVMKTFTVAAGIDTGTITPNSTYNNTDYIQVEDRTITNATKGQTGVITFDHAYTWSLNTGMVTIAQRLGGGEINSKAREILYKYYHDKFGLGEATGVELANEATGILDKPNLGDGDAVRYSNMTFGQGMDPTMMQVASAFSSVVNGGTYYHPTVLAGDIASDGTFKAASPASPRTNVISPTTSNEVRKMAIRARSAFYGANDKKGYMIGGKTGTSQTIINGEYSFDQTIGTYLGFGGDTKPRYVIMVQASGPGLAIAGDQEIPIFTDISNWMIDYLKLQPKG
jgi:cell division protein FtsI (penicillin-binding protein 3)